MYTIVKTSFSTKVCLAVLLEIQLIHLERKVYWTYGEECENVIFKKTMFSRFAGDQILAFESENLLSECKRLSKRHFQPEYV